MTNGGAWVHQKGKRIRLRKAKRELKVGQKVELFYNPAIKVPKTDGIQCLFETRSYGIWFKPAGVLTQGTNFGDEGSILRHVERVKKEAHPVNRLDLETSGVLCIAYNSKAHAAFSKIWSTKVRKYYQAIVLGTVKEDGEIDEPIDGKQAKTLFKVIESENNMTKLEVEILTGRKHQVRIHLNSINHPVMGDPKYGRGNKNEDGLKLIARCLEFKDPFDNSQKKIISPEKLF